MAKEKEEQKREIGTAKITWLQFIAGFLGFLAVMLGFFLFDEYRDTKAVDGDYCLKNEVYQQRKIDSLIDINKSLRKQRFILKAQHIADSVNIVNKKCKHF